MARTVLVTGGNRGIGLAIAQAFVKQGDRVAITHRGTFDPQNAPEVLPVTCDITDAAAVDAAFTQVEQELGPVEVLVANAGITDDTLVMRMSEEQFGRVLDTNLTGAWRCAKRASTKMLRARWGRMIFVSSVVGLMGGAGQVNYAASKAGLVGMARSLTRELATRNITFNVVAPGFIDTDMTARLGDDRKAEILKQIPAGRLAGTDEVAGVVTWLAGDTAGYVNGAVIPVDGGLGMGH
jgi:3-oxoacyl-[acyl-carrier protein] reductase